MSKDHSHSPDTTEENASDLSRRGFLGTTAIGGLTLAGLGLKPGISEAEAQDKGAPHGGSKQRTLLKGGVVLSLDPAVGDFARADVLIEGKKIVAVGPNLGADGKVIDCVGHDRHARLHQYAQPSI